MHLDSLEYAILPLYSIRRGEKVIPEKSGINQWNGGGRSRKPGESYIPVPKQVHRVAGSIFPKRDKHFELLLPNSQTVIAKLCQDGSKALMSSPNDHLNFWLYELIDGTIANYISRYSKGAAYLYEDLQSIGIDCVRFEKITGEVFKITPQAIGTYEQWLSQSTERGPDSSI
jgi:hypothetical protein